jgi:predicted amidohydrolase
MLETHEHPALRIGLVQFRPRKAQVAANLERIREHIGSAVGEKDLLVFPEASLSGYFLEGGVREAAARVQEVADHLGKTNGDHPDVVLGFYERGGGGLYNSVAHFTPVDGRYAPVHVHRKMFLPTYGLFDEGRFVRTGPSLAAYDTRFGRWGCLSARRCGTPCRLRFSRWQAPNSLSS